MHVLVKILAYAFQHLINRIFLTKVFQLKIVIIWSKWASNYIILRFLPLYTVYCTLTIIIIVIDAFKHFIY